MNEIMTMRTDLANQFAAAGAKLLDFTMTAGALAAIPNTAPQQYAVAGTLETIQKVLPAAEPSHPQRRLRHGDRPTEPLTWEGAEQSFAETYNGLKDLANAAGFNSIGDAIRAAKAAQPVEAAGAVRPRVIPLPGGESLRYETRTTGAPGWLLYDGAGKLHKALSLADVEIIEATIAATHPAEPVAYVNGDDLDNMLEDRTATIQGERTGYRATALYRGPAVGGALAATFDRKEFMRQVLESVCEIPDRDSPEDQPEMCLVTPNELKNIMLSAFERIDEDAELAAESAAPAGALVPAEVIADRQYLDGFDAGFMAGEAGDHAKRAAVHEARSAGIREALEAGALVAKAEQVNELMQERAEFVDAASHVMPPFAAPASQHDAKLAASFNGLRWLLNISEPHDRPGSRVGFLLDKHFSKDGLTIREQLEYLWSMREAITASTELASGFREGRNAQPESVSLSESAAAPAEPPIAWAITVGDDIANTFFISIDKEEVQAEYEGCVHGGFESIYTLVPLYRATNPPTPTPTKGNGDTDKGEDA